VVGSTDQPLYPKYKLNRRLGGWQSWTGCFGEDKNKTLQPETEPAFLGNSSHSPVTNLNELSALHSMCYPIRSKALHVQQKPCFLMNIKDSFCVYKHLQLVPNPSQNDPKITAYVKSLLILSSNPCLGLPTGLFHSVSLI
jgi:hypothetical protein